MPTSDYTQIPDVIRALIESRAETVLEVGVGFGKWGALCREYIEINRGRMPAEWRSRIDGIEAFEGYRNPLWSAYDNIHIGDAMTVIDGLGTYDVVLCCDVIEHFEKEDGRRLLEKMLHHGRLVIITSPADESPQDAVYGNPHEEHKSWWTEADFASYPHRFARLGETFIAAVSHDPGAVAAADIRPLDERLGARQLSRMTLRLLGRRVTSAVTRRRH